MSETHRVTWFVPDRPVNGGTVHIRPETDPGEDVDTSVVESTVD